VEVIKETLDKMAFINIPHIGIRDILDILVVSYVIYIVLVWIKDTRTWALFKGVFIILMVAIVSYVLQLHTLWWVISNAITVGMIALLVVFQPELRRALEQIGRGSFYESLLSMPDHLEGMTDEAIESITKACIHMAKFKTGALIVIEQDTKLGDIQRTGINIDAAITSQLLINIFEKNTPLHDGAVIVRSNRIAAATCFLPLTDSLEVSKELGTRHRAAIGISEVSDAMVLVVSEETGAISYVRNGKIRRGLDMEIIKKILISTRRKKRPNKKKPIWKGNSKNE